MANMIELVNKYLPILDAQYKLEARSSILDVAPEFVQMTRDAKKVKIAKMRVDGLADYSRNNGFTTGSMELTWEEHEFTQDRGRAIQVDVMDDTETFGLAFGRLAGEFQRLHVIPEIDAYRFSKYYQKAATKQEITLDAGAIIKYIDDIDAQMDDDEVHEEDRILFVNPTVFKFIMNDPELVKRISVEGVQDKTVNKKFYYYNGHLIIKVPSTRFYTAIETLDGSSSGEEVGGYKMATGAKIIAMLMIQRWSVIQLAKRRIARVWAPTRELAAGTDGVNPNADAWKFDFRVYHDAWALDNKLNGIYGATLADVGITSVDITTSDSDVTIAGNAGARTASISMTSVDAFLAEAKVTATGGASTAVTWSTSDNTKASVDASGNVSILASGSAVITATSVYDPTKKATLTLTITA